MNKVFISQPMKDITGLSIDFFTLDEAAEKLVSVNDSAKMYIKLNLEQDGKFSTLNRVENYIRDIESLITAIHKELKLII